MTITITRDAATVWLAEHGLDANDVLSVSVDLEAHDLGRPLGMNVTLMRRNGDGRPYLDDDSRLATVTVPVLVRSFPELTAHREETR